jgi:hypothetical protein
MWYVEETSNHYYYHHFIGLVLIAIVTWLFDIRIHRIEEKKKSAVVSVCEHAKNCGQVFKNCYDKIVGVPLESSCLLAKNAGQNTNGGWTVPPGKMIKISRSEQSI